MGVVGQHHARATLPPGKTRYPLNRRLGGPPSRSGQVRKISPSQRFDPRTVQPVASRYTDSILRKVLRLINKTFIMGNITTGTKNYNRTAATLYTACFMCIRL